MQNPCACPVKPTRAPGLTGSAMSLSSPSCAAHPARQGPIKSRKAPQKSAAEKEIGLVSTCYNRAPAVSTSGIGGPDRVWCEGRHRYGGIKSIDANFHLLTYTQNLSEGLARSIWQNGVNDLTKYLTSPAVVMTVVIADEVTSLAVDFGDLVGVDVTAFHLTKDNVANFVAGAFLKGEEAPAFQNRSHRMAKGLGLCPPLRGEFLLHAFVF